MWVHAIANRTTPLHAGMNTLHAHANNSAFFNLTNMVRFPKYGLIYYCVCVCVYVCVSVVKLIEYIGLSPLSCSLAWGTGSQVAGALDPDGEEN